MQCHRIFPTIKPEKKHALKTHIVDILERNCLTSEPDTGKIEPNPPAVSVFIQAAANSDACRFESNIPILMKKYKKWSD